VNYAREIGGLFVSEWREERKGREESLNFVMVRFGIHGRGGCAMIGSQGAPAYAPLEVLQVAAPGGRCPLLK